MLFPLSKTHFYGVVCQFTKLSIAKYVRPVGVSLPQMFTCSSSQRSKFSLTCWLNMHRKFGVTIYRKNNHISQKPSRCEQLNSPKKMRPSPHLVCLDVNKEKFHVYSEV